MEFKFVVKVKAEEKEFEIPVNLSKMLELLQSCLSKELTKEIEKVVEEKEEDEENEKYRDCLECEEEDEEEEDNDDYDDEKYRPWRVEKKDDEDDEDDDYCGSCKVYGKPTKDDDKREYEVIFSFLNHHAIKVVPCVIDIVENFIKGNLFEGGSIAIKALLYSGGRLKYFIDKQTYTEEMDLSEAHNYIDKMKVFFVCSPKKLDCYEEFIFKKLRGIGLCPYISGTKMR